MKINCLKILIVFLIAIIVISGATIASVLLKNNNVMEDSTGYSNIENTKTAEESTYYFEKNSDVVASGTLGNDIEWVIYSSGDLLVKGKGEMHNYEKSPFLPYKSQINNIHISEGVTNIGAWVFGNLSNIKTIEFPSSLKVIEDNALRNCTFSSINLNEGLEKIGSQAFFYCSNLVYFEIPSTVNSIGSYAFGHCGFNNIVIPEGVAVIEEGTFYSMDLEYIKIPSTVTTIKTGAFDIATLCRPIIEYNGTEEDWNKIDINYNDNIHLYGTDSLGMEWSTIQFAD